MGPAGYFRKDASIYRYAARGDRCTRSNRDGVSGGDDRDNATDAARHLRHVGPGSFTGGGTMSLLRHILAFDVRRHRWLIAAWIVATVATVGMQTWAPFFRSGRREIE